MFAENKKAKFDYEVIESYEAGIQLTGAEVKSVRNGGANFAGARVLLEAEGASLIGLNIQKYKHDSREDFNPSRTRKLLLHKKEIVAIQTKMRSAGLTLVPLKLYNKGSLVKVQVALVRGKKKFEKRELIKKRDSNLELARRLKTNR
ncbi:MAG: SsrA-binding protein [Candidatus Collierbacteria bacterium GW2011_GWB1_44_6]|uniref:SsrA-binding protein n=2 Tax=Candidatus Collieribacteriota TaxID=1752725 RepID=A0A0G1LVS4_9BACT|nr:MAG: SsrA-binding protein [Candidatus Collierbacteria bacterium GW2011_GWC2_43_12]KKT72917.1 MAG: SsrA-binding protein [Candidatus Collierbacteria bacterium GW2011_GWB1_44_6]KKT83086.1 MAG: SsrA-binding protein, SsrA-binding protein [Microgenomates group bacterium GW2011_GWC1_44_9]